MSRICRNVGDSGKLWFYELDHETKMRRLKTHFHTSNGLAMEPGKTRRKAVEGNADHVTRQTTHQKPVAYRRCGGGGDRKDPTANETQKRHYGKANLCRKEGERRP